MRHGRRIYGTCQLIKAGDGQMETKKVFFVRQETAMRRFRYTRVRLLNPRSTLGGKIFALITGLLVAFSTWADVSDCENLVQNKNWSGAFSVCKKAADAGDPKAKSYLAEMYGYGKGVAQDLNKALKLFESAGLDGVGSAQVALGNAYYYGRDVVLQDFYEAAKWYKKAARNGIAWAQYMTGTLYGEGKGVEKDDVKSYVWLNIASANGYEGAAMLRDLVAISMHSDDIETAQRQAKRCLETQYKHCD